MNLRRDLTRLTIVLVLLIVLVAIVISGEVTSDDQPSFVARLWSVTDLRAASISERLELWKASREMYLDHPLLGVGPGNWKLHYPAYGTQGTRASEGELFFQRPHNDYIWVLTETGPLGLACHLALMGIVAFYGIRLMHRGRSRLES